MKFTIIFLLTINVAYSQQFLDDLNRERKGIRKLEYDSSLSAGCKKWLESIGDKLVHDKPVSFKGEVLTTAEDPLTAWMKSPPHRAILLDRKITKIGFYSHNSKVCARVK